MTLPEVERLRAEITRLEQRERELARALAEFEHQGRRYRDGLERAGGQSAELESRMAMLKDNLELTRTDRAYAARRLQAVRAELAAHESGGPGGC